MRNFLYRILSATIFWTVRGTDSYMALPTHVEGPFAEAEIRHFSDGFVGSGECVED